MYKAVIVDDEAEILFGLTRTIDWESYHFHLQHATTSSLDALEHLKANRVDLLITDITMPEMSGLDLIRHAKELQPDLSIIVISAYDDFQYVKTALRGGAENYILKPIDIEEFSASVGFIANRQHEKRFCHGADATPENILIGHWLRNTYDYNALQEQAELFSVNLIHSDYTAVVFTGSGNADVRPKIIRSLLLPCLREGLAGFFHETKGRLCLVLCGLADSDTSLEKAILRFSDTLQRENLAVFISAGPTVTDCMRVSPSYQKACRNLFMAKSRLRFILAENMRIEPSLFNQMDALLSEGEVSAARELIARMLHDSAQPMYTAVLVAATCIKRLERDTGDVFDKYPALGDAVSAFPVNGKREAYLQWTLKLMDVFGSALPDLSGSMYPVVSSVIQFIRRFSHTELSLKDLAQRHNISPAYLGYIFKQQTGSFFNEYLNKVRLECARQLMLTTDLRLNHIATKVGYANQAYFTRSFKRFYGLTPVEYRRENVDSD